MKLDTQHLIIGSGIAGLKLALKLGQTQKVTVISKSDFKNNSSYYAQGGIASVLGKGDDFDRHVKDTLVAGAGLCHIDIVKMVVEGGPSAIKELIDLGVDFTRGSDGDSGFPYHLTMEGGHSRRRVIHADDLTGKEVLNALLTAVREHSNVTLLEQAHAIDLLTTDKYAPGFHANRCLGAYVFDRKLNRIYSIRAENTCLCTGGHGKVYLYTSNPDTATGDGVAMGWRAGCRVANMEFMQFHPTCLFSSKSKTFLITEAMRGEGGIIKNYDGDAFMDQWHPMGSLAPRDVVARAIDAELKRSGKSHLYLDVMDLGEEKLKSHFPNIYKTCLEEGIDITKDMIPIVPAAHYSCGGLVVDDIGMTNINSLYVVGEAACTGLHGANRLASNSLLEALVFADRVGRHLLSKNSDPVDVEIPDWNARRSVESDELVVLSHTWDEIRRLMWNYVGIVRTDKRLERALHRIQNIREELTKHYWDYQLTSDFIEVRNLADVAWLTIRCALARKESRGIHFNMDHPGQMSSKDTIIC